MQMIASIICAVACIVIMICQLIQLFQKRKIKVNDSLNFSDIKNQNVLDTFMKDVIEYGTSKNIQVEVSSIDGTFELNYVEPDKGFVAKICDIVLPDNSDTKSNVYLTCINTVKEQIDNFIVNNLENKK